MNSQDELAETIEKTLQEAPSELAAYGQVVAELGMAGEGKVTFMKYQLAAKNESSAYVKVGVVLTGLPP